jgi:NAD(P)-dependent dehydrogenase (short-subunit alcohol dehydrogenase family)
MTPGPIWPRPTSTAGRSVRAADDVRGAVGIVLAACSGLRRLFGSQAAAWAMTDAIRQELAPRGISVTAVHVGYMDTDMAAFAPADQKIDPAVVARLALDGLLAGEPKILADELTRATKAHLSGG